MGIDSWGSDRTRPQGCLRLSLGEVILPPAHEALLAFDRESIDHVPAIEGVFQLLDADKNVIAIKGVMDIHAELLDTLEDNDRAHFFTYEQDAMFTKRESELIQQHLQAHGELPGGGDDDLDDLF